MEGRTAIWGIVQCIHSLSPDEYYEIGGAENINEIGENFVMSVCFYAIQLDKRERQYKYEIFMSLIIQLECMRG